MIRYRFMIYIHRQHKKHHEVTDVFYREESYYSEKLRWWEAPETKLFLEAMIKRLEINHAIQYCLNNNGTDVYCLERMIKGNKMAISYFSHAFEIIWNSIGLNEATIENRMINIPSAIFLAQIL
jgi:hypothetical protein